MAALVTAGAYKVRSVEWDDEARAAIGALYDDPRIDTTAGLGCVDDIEGGLLFEVLEGRRVAGRYVLRVVKLARGYDVQCVALAGQSGSMDIIEAVHAAVCTQVRDAAALTVTTKRPGLVRKLARLGFEVAGVVMRKRLDGGRGHVRTH